MDCVYRVENNTNESAVSTALLSLPIIANHIALSLERPRILLAILFNPHLIHDRIDKGRNESKSNALLAGQANMAAQRGAF